jgi:hypothetical protein
MSYRPIMYTYEGECYCDDCEPTDVPSEEVGACFDESEAHGATCGECGACYVEGYGWEPHEVAVGNSTVWTVCDGCGSQKPYARDVYLRDRKRIKRACVECGEKGAVHQLRPRART